MRFQETIIHVVDDNELREMYPGIKVYEPPEDPEEMVRPKHNFMGSLMKLWMRFDDWLSEMLVDSDDEDFEETNVRRTDISKAEEVNDFKPERLVTRHSTPPPPPSIIAPFNAPPPPPRRIPMKIAKMAPISKGIAPPVTRSLKIRNLTANTMNEDVTEKKCSSPSNIPSRVKKDKSGVNPMLAAIRRGITLKSTETTKDLNEDQNQEIANGSPPKLVIPKKRCLPVQIPTASEREQKQRKHNGFTPKITKKQNALMAAIRGGTTLKPAESRTFQDEGRETEITTWDMLRETMNIRRKNTKPESEVTAASGWSF